MRGEKIDTSAHLEAAHYVTGYKLLSKIKCVVRQIVSFGSCLKGCVRGGETDDGLASNGVGDRQNRYVEARGISDTVGGALCFRKRHKVNGDNFFYNTTRCIISYYYYY